MTCANFGWRALRKFNRLAPSDCQVHNKPRHERPWFPLFCTGCQRADLENQHRPMQAAFKVPCPLGGLLSQSKTWIPCSCKYRIYIWRDFLDRMNFCNRAMGSLPNGPRPGLKSLRAWSTAPFLRYRNNWSLPTFEAFQSQVCKVQRQQHFPRVTAGSISLHAFGSLELSWDFIEKRK